MNTVDRNESVERSGSPWTLSQFLGVLRDAFDLLDIQHKEREGLQCKSDASSWERDTFLNGSNTALENVLKNAGQRLGFEYMEELRSYIKSVTEQRS